MAWFLGTDLNRPASVETAVLLVNLGTPAAPTAGPIRRYLAQFLGDLRVVEACPWYWLPILHGPILTFRPRKTARLYRSIWMPEGSPLWVYSKALADALAAHYADRPSVRVALAMTYGEPSIAKAVAELQTAGVGRVIVLPLYPQYSGSTTGAVFDAIARSYMKWRWVPNLTFVSDYHAHSAYIAALADSVRAVWARSGRAHLVISNHGIPAKYVTAGDPYRNHTQQTSRLLVAELGLGEGEYSECFQSRFGPTEWLQPYTDDRLLELAQQGVREVTVITPSFAVDCLETLEEIGTVSKEKFLAAGGSRFELVPALNESPAHIAALAAVLAEHGLP
jgi:protoporphyrin/coproporphyrin ferrochelatase